jgi:hypothetical protein
MTGADHGGTPPILEKSTATTSKCDEKEAENTTKVLELKGYPTVVPKPNVLVAKTTGRQRQLPITAIKKRIVTKSEESGEEGEIITSNTVGEFIKRLEEMERSSLEKDRTIAKLEEEIDYLKKAMSRVTEREKTSPKATLVTKGTDGTGPQRSKESPEVGPKLPPPAWQGPKPDWLTVGKKGKVVKTTATADKPVTTSQVPKKTISDEMVERFISGQPPKQKGLRFIYVKGVQRWRYSQLREIMVKLGIQPHWTRHFAMVATDVLELLVFEEKKEEIEKILKEKAPCYEVLTEHDPLQGAVKDLKNAEARLKRQIGRLPAPMHTTRKVLSGQLETVQSRLKSRSEAEEATSKAMDVTEPEVSATEACNGTQRTDV